MENKGGLVIRFFMGAFVLCDGKCQDGLKVEAGEDEGYIGNIVKVFDTWEAANNMRAIIDASYGA